MRKRKGVLLDLQYDILKEILIRAARSSDGSKIFANVISVCKDFRQFIDDEDVLRAVAFDDLLISGRWELFQLREGLICRCAMAGQVQAQFLLGKIILMSTTFMLMGKRRTRNKASSSSAQAQEDSLTGAIAQGSSFLENFLGDGTCPNFIGHHFEFVKIFLSRAKFTEVEEMLPQLARYVIYFMWRKRRVTQHLGTFVSRIVRVYIRVCTFEEELEPPTVKLVNEARDINLQLLKKLEGQWGKIELQAEEREEVCNGHLLTVSTTSLVEKLDKLLKHLNALNSIIMQGIDEAYRKSGKMGVELAPAVLTSLSVKLIVDRVEELKARASFYQEMRKLIISKFHDFICRST